VLALRDGILAERNNGPNPICRKFSNIKRRETRYSDENFTKDFFLLTAVFA
jgi:hypothetical protein